MQQIFNSETMDTNRNKTNAHTRTIEYIDYLLTYQDALANSMRQISHNNMSAQLNID